MKLLFVRHGEPDYSIDSLTEKGWREAEYLSERLTKLDIKKFFVSPLGRAKDTAAATLNKLGRTAEECGWLREFNIGILRPDKDKRTNIPWDWMPKDWTAYENFYSPDKWWDNEILREAHVKEEYDKVVKSFDGLLAELGYVRSGHLYNAVCPNEDTYVFFCHFGVTCLIAGHLLGVSPMVLWHGTFAAPTSVTAFVTEERQKGAASFRMGSFGDVYHLYAENEPASFSGRFCEIFDSDDRH